MAVSTIAIEHVQQQYVTFHLHALCLQVKMHTCDPWMYLILMTYRGPLYVKLLMIFRQNEKLKRNRHFGISFTPHSA